MGWAGTGTSRNRLVGAAVFSLILAGCGHLYDAERDEAAKAVVTSNDSIDLNAIFTDIRKNLDTLHAADVKVYSDSGAIQAELDLYDILRIDEEAERNGDPPVAFSQWVLPNASLPRGRALSDDDHDLEKLGFDLADDIGTALTNAAYFREALKDKDAALTPVSVDDPDPTTDRVSLRLLEELRVDGEWLVPKPERNSCKDLVARDGDWAVASAGPGLSADAETYIRDTFDGLITRCNRLIVRAGRMNQGKDFDPASQIGGAYAEWQSAITALAGVDTQFAATKQAIANATPAKGDPAKSLVETLTGKVPDIVAILDKAKEMHSSVTDPVNETLGTEIAISDERITAISTLLTSFETGSANGFEGDAATLLETDEDLRRATIVAAALPGIVGDLDSLAKALDAPEGRAGLLVLLNQEMIRLDYLKAQKELLTQRREVARQTLKLYLDIAVMYRDGYDALGRAGPLKDASLSAILKAPNSYHKRMAMRCVLGFVRIRAVLYPQAGALAAKQVDLAHREAVLVNEYAVKSWKALIDSPVRQLAEFWQSGVKPEVLANMAVGLGELGILGFLGGKAIDD